MKPLKQPAADEIHYAFELCFSQVKICSKEVFYLSKNGKSFFNSALFG